MQTLGLSSQSQRKAHDIIVISKVLTLHYHHVHIHYLFHIYIQ